MDAPLVVRTGGPNAGHTVVDEDGKVYKLRQLPTAAISNPDATLAIAAGSLIDPEVLQNEIVETGVFADWTRLIVDPQATIIEPHHKESEARNSRLTNWSTQKGIGQARSDRVMRRAQIAADYWADSADWVFRRESVSDIAQDALRVGRPVLIEAAQGYGLGLHTKYYPKTTSADCRAIDALADVGISPWGATPRVWVVVRPYPIRVAGDSGPLQGETTWAALGLAEERTTVTNKVRRVGGWDPGLVHEAIRANGGPSTNVVVALTMVDQLIPSIAGMTDYEDLNQLDRVDQKCLRGWIGRINDLGAAVGVIGTGPGTMVFLEDAMPPGAPIDSAIHRSREWE